MNPEVSVIMPNYNCGKFIIESINSVKNQTYKNWELIISDDCSLDDSIEIINKSILNNDNIILIQNKFNSGSGITRNNALEIARGRYIAFLDSDDIWHKDKLKKHLEFIKKNEAVLSYTSYEYIDEQNKIIKKTYNVRNNNTYYKDLLKKTDIGCLTAIYDTEKLGKVYMKDIRRKQDYALWLDILKRGNYATPFGEVLAYYRVRKGSVTSNKFLLIKNHYSFLRKTQKLNFFKSIYYTVCWGMNGFEKFFISRIKF